MNQIEELKRTIRSAFSTVEYPGDTNLRDSNEGEEPFLVEEAFRGKRDWAALEPGFIDLAPDGFASALSFFSAAAFRYYLPAYLVADLNRQLRHTSLAIYLTHGLTDATKDVPVNPIRYGDYTWLAYVSERFSGFSAAETEAIVGYLKFKRQHVHTQFERNMIDEALQNYWLGRLKAAQA